MTNPGKRRHNRANRTTANEKNSPKQNVSMTDSNTSTDQSQGVLSIVMFKMHSFFTMLYLMVLSAKRFMCRAIVTVCRMLLWPLSSVLKWIKGDDFESDVENPVDEYRIANKSREYQLRIQELEKQIKEQQREVERLHRKLKDQEEKYNYEIACKAEEVERQNSNHKVEINNFIRAKNALKEELEAERKERESLSCRLSKVLSNQLTNNNPNIADLSDMNRPTKLAEKFSELYDNEWTNAFAVVEKRFKEPETIAILLGILKDCFMKCRQYAKIQLDAAKLKTAEIKQAKDELKKTAHLTLPLVNELIDNSIQGTPDQPFYDDKTVLTYVRRCTELCWYMAVQDPPMALAVPEDKEYNKAYYREYTNSGKFVKYVVWPAILIQDGGDRMTKGIVQCCDSLKDPQLPVADQQ